MHEKNKARADTAMSAPVTKNDTVVCSGRIAAISEEEHCIHILRGLISYHKRMTMGYYPERDFYIEALEYALKCVEEKIKK